MLSSLGREGIGNGVMMWKRREAFLGMNGKPAYSDYFSKVEKDFIYID